MPFVKLDCGILTSTLWFDRDVRDVFITALLMAEPHETLDAIPQLSVDKMEPTGFVVPPGWYGMVHASGKGIVHEAQVPMAAGLAALKILGDPEPDSRSQDFDGRRLVRINGGYLILNYMKYRERDYTGAERAARYRMRLRDKQDDRDRHAASVTSRRNVTQAEAEAEAEAEVQADVRTDLAVRPASRSEALAVRTADRQEGTGGFDAFWQVYPRRTGKQAALAVWRRLRPDASLQARILQAVRDQSGSEQWLKDGGQFIPHPRTWLQQGRWDDEPVQVPTMSENTTKTLTAGARWLAKQQKTEGGPR